MTFEALRQLVIVLPSRLPQGMGAAKRFWQLTTFHDFVLNTSEVYQAIVFFNQVVSDIFSTVHVVPTAGDLTNVIVILFEMYC